jgi:uncharacterized OB-fold protein
MTRPRPETRNAGRAYWKAAAEGRLVLPHCTSCAKPFWHPRPHCPACGSQRVEWKAASGKGSVHTFTIVRQSADAYFRARVPYVVAMIDLDEGVRIMSNVVDCAPEAVAIGMRVRVTYERLDGAIGIPLFVPESSAP